MQALKILLVKGAGFLYREEEKGIFYGKKFDCNGL